MVSATGCGRAFHQVVLGDARALAGADVPLRAEREAEHRLRQVDERGDDRALGDLALVRAHRGPLRVQVPGDVDPRGQLRLRLAEVDLGQLRALVGLGGQAAADLVPVAGGLVDPRRAGDLGGPVRHLVALDVVRVPVPAVVVVRGEHVGVLGAQDLGERPRCLLDVGGRERARRVVRRRAGLAGVDVAQGVHLRDPEDVPARARLGQPPLHQRLALGQVAVGQVVLLAAGRHHDHHPMTLVGRLAQHTAAAQARVVGMGVKRDQRRHVGSPCLPEADRPAPAVDVGMGWDCAANSPAEEDRNFAGDSLRPHLTLRRPRRCGKGLEGPVRRMSNIGETAGALCRPRVRRTPEDVCPPHP